MTRSWKLSRFWLTAALALVVLACLGPSKPAEAANPTTMSFQGKVVNANGTNVTDGSYPFTFKIYNNGSFTWGETQSSVQVTAGVFQVNLGSVCGLTVTQTCSGFSNTAINFSTMNNLTLGITFNNDAAGEMTPRIALQSVPYAFNADTATTAATATNALSLGGIVASSYVQLSPGSQQSGAISINGNGTFGGNLLITGTYNGNTFSSTALTFSAASTSTIQAAPSQSLSLDSGSGTAMPLILGNANASAINLNQNTTIAAAKTLTITSGATSLTGGTTGDALTVSNNTSTGNIAVFKSNTTTVATLGIVSSATTLTLSGTTPTITTGATSLKLQQTGDTLGATSLTLESRVGSAGALFTNSALGLVDFGFLGTNSGTPTKQGNLRYEARSGSIQGTNNSNGELEWLDDATGSFSYTFVTGKGTTSVVEGNFGVGTVNPTSLLSVGSSSQFQVNSSGAIVALTGITTSGGYLQSGTTTNTFTGASTFSAAGTALSVTNSATIGTGLTVTTGGATITGNSSVTGNLTINTATASQLVVTSGASVPTASQLSITNTGSTGDTTANVNGLAVAYKGGAAAVEAAGERIDLQPGTTSGGTWDALRIVPNATGAVSGVTENGLKLDALTTPGPGTENALNVGTGWDNILQSASVVITQAGAISGVTTLTAGTVNATTAFQANGVAGAARSCSNTQFINTEVVTEGIMTSSGGCTAPLVSDIRLKQNIVPLGDDVLSKIERVNPVNFDFNCNADFFVQDGVTCDATEQTGVIAQEIGQIFPDLVYLDSQGYYEVKYQGLSVYTLKAVSELGQHLDAQGNATLHTVTADSLHVTGNLSVDGSLSYSSLSTPTGNFSTQVITPSLVSNGALAINSGTSGDVTLDSGGNSAVVNIGTSNAAVVNIAHAGATTDIKGALVADGPTELNGSLTMHFNDPGTTFKIDNAGSGQAVAAAIQIKDSSGSGYTTLISTPSFSVAGNGDLSTNGSIVSHGGSFQLLDPTGGQLINFDQAGNADFKGSLNLASASLSGGLSVGGDANFAGLSSFQKLATFLGKTIFRQNVEFDGHLTVASDTAGYAALRVGEASVHVSFKTPYGTAPVVNANLVNGQFGLVSVNNVTPTGFDLALPAPATLDTTLSWTALAVTDPQTAANPTPAAPTTP